MPARKDSGSLSAFAEANGLTAGTGGEMPRTGSLLSRGELRVEGATHGALPGGENGTILHSTYETRSDDTTTVHKQTTVVLRVPESIGYAPYLQFGVHFGLGGVMGSRRTLEPAPDVRVIAAEGIDEGWLKELFSPAFSEWLQRNPDDFGAELADGVLVVLRDGHISDPTKLTALCTDAARIAEALREESIEESEAGGGSVAKPDEPDREERLARLIVTGLGVEGGRPAPANVESEVPEAQRLARRSGALTASVVRSTLLWMIGINIIGGGIYGLLLTVGDPLTNVIIWQLILLGVLGPLLYRSRRNAVAKRAAEAAFYVGYADSRNLEGVEPLGFAAAHADAGLPGRPIRVFEGLFGGVPGHLMLTGDGRERGQSIALVRGVRGPTATAELNFSAPGASTKAMDEYVETLLLDLETAPAG